MRLIAQRIDSSADPILVEQMRLMFNSGLIYLATKPTCVAVSEEEQQAWWKGLDHSKVKVHIYRPIEKPWVLAAFSVLTDRGDHVTPLFATNPDLAGKGNGIGWQIIQHYISEAGKRLLGEQLVSHEAIRHLNAMAGWTVIETVTDRFPDGRGVELLEHPGTMRHYPDYGSMLDYWGEPLSDQEVWKRVI